MIPRVLRRQVAKEWVQSHAWSPRDLLAAVASTDGSSSSSSSSTKISFTVKKSAPSNRFFMYEEHGGVKLQDADGPTQVLEVSSATHLAELLHDTSGEAYYYWTSPVQAVAPDLLTSRLQGYETLYHEDEDDEQQKPPEFLDPRGPSLWMSNSGAGTQAHYDVADNILVQLYGTKRIRCYPPSAATALYVFPDAHPRARKSQVSFDQPNLDKFPLFATPLLPDPVLDVILQPGDAISIPAFWFHHVENGRIPNYNTTTSANPNVSSNKMIQDGPTVSLNLFSISRPMMMAQQIFVEASRPLTISQEEETEQRYQVSIAALRALGKALLKGLVQIQAIPSSDENWDWIQTMLLDTRYAPLHGSSSYSSGSQSAQQDTDPTVTLSSTQQEQVQACIDRILPLFAALHQEQQQHDPDHGILRLVVCHLFELWAVELVGAPHVAEAWQAAIRTQKQ